MSNYKLAQVWKQPYQSPLHKLIMLEFANHALEDNKARYETEEFAIQKLMQFTSANYKSIAFALYQLQSDGVVTIHNYPDFVVTILDSEVQS